MEFTIRKRFLPDAKCFIEGVKDGNGGTSWMVVEPFADGYFKWQQRRTKFLISGVGTSFDDYVAAVKHLRSVYKKYRTVRYINTDISAKKSVAV